MDAVKGLLAQLLASTGLGVNKEVMLVAAFALAVMVVAVALALSRRRNRLEERLEDPRQPHPSVGEAEPHLVRAQEAVSDALPDFDRSKQHLAGANRLKAEPTGDLARLATDLASMRETVATNVPSTRAELMTVHESVQNYQGRIELLQATLTSLQSEQLTLRRLLESCNSGLKSIEQLAAAVPSLRTEHAALKKQLAELNARFDAASEVLAELLQSEDLPNDH